jgi:hypothetical protein
LRPGEIEELAAAVFGVPSTPRLYTVDALLQCPDELINARFMLDGFGLGFAGGVEERLSGRNELGRAVFGRAMLHVEPDEEVGQSQHVQSLLEVESEKSNSPGVLRLE